MKFRTEWDRVVVYILCTCFCLYVATCTGKHTYELYRDVMKGSSCE